VQFYCIRSEAQLNMAVEYIVEILCTYWGTAEHGGRIQCSYNVYVVGNS